VLGENRRSGLSSYDEQTDTLELDRLDTNEMFFKGIFFVACFGGDLDRSSEGDERLVDRKFLSAFC
jgi:hypothetical protein